MPTFNIQIRPEKVAGLTTQQLSLLRATASSPTTLRRMARMALETDLAEISGVHLSDVFTGATNAELVGCLLACLPEEDKPFWEDLNEALGDEFVEALMPVFLAFDVTIRRANTGHGSGRTRVQADLATRAGRFETPVLFKLEGRCGKVRSHDSS